MNKHGEKRLPRPLDSARLEELALAYVARFATSAAKLEGYLARKLRERGWEGDGPAPVSDLVERFVRSGYVDDLAYARMKSASLLRRAALAMAQKRGFGPFGRSEPDRAAREKQIAAMLRAGHRLDSARELVNAASQDAALDWARQGEEDE